MAIFDNNCFGCNYLLRIYRELSARIEWNRAIQVHSTRLAINEDH